MAHRSSRLIGLGRATWLATAVGLLAATSALAVATTGSYSGKTSEKQPVTFKITHHGKVITGFSTTLFYDGKCGQGGGPVFYAKASRIAIKTGGKFSQHVTLRFNAAVHSPGVISGTASGTQVRGKVVQYLNGKPNKCYTETFRAHKT